MKLFKDYLEEMYNFLPTSTKDIAASPLPNKTDVAQVFVNVSAAAKDAGIEIADPLAIDLSFPNTIKVHRKLEGSVDLSKLTSGKIKLSFGNGSRGNAGEGNKGIAFERFLSKDLGLYVMHRNPNDDFKYKTFMKPFIDQYLKGAKDIEIKDMGALNQKRPLMFRGNGIYILKPVADIGGTVTDITVVADRKEHHLSLKMGGTVTFFNSGVTKFLTKQDIENGKVTNADGLKILKMLGIDPDKYVKVFAGYDSNQAQKKAPKEVDNVTRKVDMKVLKDFLASGVGYGYYLVHADNISRDKVSTHYFGTASDVMQAVTPQSVKVLYPQQGTAKRIDVEIETPMFTFKVNIRNKQGGIAPSHIMCDYKIKGH